MKLKTLALVLLLAVSCALSAEGADPDATYFGVAVWDVSYSDSTFVTGGTYLRLGGSMMFLGRGLLNVNFDTNILSNAWKDRLLSAEATWEIFNGEAYGLAVGASYLTNLDHLGSSNHVGATVIPFRSNPAAFDRFRMYVSFFPFTYYYGLESKDSLWALTFIDFKVFL